MAAGVILVWLVTGPLFHYSDTWQLAINTGTTIITFLMVFLIQNTQNRDTEALQVKLDELLRATAGAHNALLDLEELEEKELNKIRSSYTRLAQKAREDLRLGTVGYWKPGGVVDRGTGDGRRGERRREKGEGKACALPFSFLPSLSYSGYSYRSACIGSTREARRAGE